MRGFRLEYGFCNTNRHRLDARKQVGIRTGGGRIEDTVEGAFDVFVAERLPVVELHALAQPKDIGRLVGRQEAGRQVRLHLHLGIPAQQPGVEQGGEVIRRERGERGRIEPDRVGIGADGQRPPAFGRSALRHGHRGQ
jgi:hypothetical protein